MKNDKIEEIVKDWNTVAPEYRTPEKLVELALHQQREEIWREVIALSDQIGAAGETTMDEWRGFKKFRDTLRDKYNSAQTLHDNEKEV